MYVVGERPWMECGLRGPEQLDPRLLLMFRDLVINYHSGAVGNRIMEGL